LYLLPGVVGSLVGLRLRVASSETQPHPLSERLLLRRRRQDAPPCLLRGIVARVRKYISSHKSLRLAF
jgi:hypothetical protein